jgi:hypothetical protein
MILSCHSVLFYLYSWKELSNIIIGKKENWYCFNITKLFCLEFWVHPLFARVFKISVPLKRWNCFVSYIADITLLPLKCKMVKVNALIYFYLHASKLRFKKKMKWRDITHVLYYLLMWGHQIYTICYYGQEIASLSVSDVDPAASWLEIS